MVKTFRAAAVAAILFLAALSPPLAAVAQGVTVQQLPPATAPLPLSTVFWCGYGSPPGHTYSCTLDQINSYIIGKQNTWSGRQVFATSTSSAASINLPPGTAPISPQTGDMWCTSASCYVRTPASGTVSFGTVLSSSGSITATHIACWVSSVLLNDCGAPPAAVTLTAGTGISVGSSPNYTVGITTGGVTNSQLTTMAANRVKANVTGSTAAPTDVALPSCSGTGVALNYTSGTGFGCPGPFGVLANPEAWGGSQRVTVQAITIATATFTPNLDTGGDFTVAMSSACPCTFANPSTTPVAGQHGVIYVTQDGTGSRTMGTWGSSYVSTGGTSSILLSTAANAIDVLTYAVKDSTHIVLSLAAQNVTH